MRGRAFASLVLIVVAALLAPVALVSNTAHKLLTDTDYFVQTLSPIVDEDSVQQLIIERSTQAIREQAGLDQLVTDLFAGLDGLNLPSRATQALQLLKGPAADGVGALVERVVTTVVTSDAFRDVVGESLRISHTQLVATLSGNSDVLQLTARGEVGIALDPILARVRVALADSGIPLGSLIPRTDVVIVIAESAQLAQLVWLYQLAVAVGPWLQWVVVALFLLGVLVARRWATAIVVVGLAVALVAAIAGPYRWSSSLRGFAGAGADVLRTAGERHGVTTGRVGAFVYRARVGIRVAVGITAAAIILFVRPLTPAIIVWTFVLALLVVAVARVFERPMPEEPLHQPVG